MRKLVGNVDVVQVPTLVSELHAGWLMRGARREKIQLAQVRYEETKRGGVVLVAQLKDGNELVYDITNIPSRQPRTTRTRTKNVKRKE